MCFVAESLATPTTGKLFEALAQLLHGDFLQALHASEKVGYVVGVDLSAIGQLARRHLRSGIERVDAATTLDNVFIDFGVGARLRSVSKSFLEISDEGTSVIVVSALVFGTVDFLVLQRLVDDLHHAARLQVNAVEIHIGPRAGLVD